VKVSKSELQGRYMHLQLELTHEDDTWMARCSAIQGLLVTGDTINQVLGELPIVAKALFEACQEKGWVFVKDAPEVSLSDIVWVIELPHPILEAA
jgi:predicted RNase H-like HicB family nuclease